jgi:hypothetical protein
MKKITFFLASLVMFSSCEEVTEFNNPTLQAMNGEELFRADSPIAVVHENGSVTLQGSDEFGTLEIKIASIQPGTYVFGENTASIATYNYTADGMSFFYSTAVMDTEIGQGEVVIYTPDNPKSGLPGTISGEFSFRAHLTNDNPFAEPEIYFHHGWFYNLPLGSTLPVIPENQTEE